MRLPLLMSSSPEIEDKKGKRSLFRSTDEQALDAAQQNSFLYRLMEIIKNDSKVAKQAPLTTTVNTNSAKNEQTQELKKDKTQNVNLQGSISFSKSKIKESVKPKNETEKQESKPEPKRLSDVIALAKKEGAVITNIEFQKEGTVKETKSAPLLQTPQASETKNRIAKVAKEKDIEPKQEIKIQAPESKKVESGKKDEPALNVQKVEPKKVDNSLAREIQEERGEENLLRVAKSDTLSKILQEPQKTGDSFAKKEESKGVSPSNTPKQKINTETTKEAQQTPIQTQTLKEQEQKIEPEKAPKKDETTKQIKSDTLKQTNTSQTLKQQPKKEDEETQKTIQPREPKDSSAPLDTRALMQTKDVQKGSKKSFFTEQKEVGVAQKTEKTQTEKTEIEKSPQDIKPQIKEFADKDFKTAQIATKTGYHTETESKMAEAIKEYRTKKGAEGEKNAKILETKSIIPQIENEETVKEPPKSKNVRADPKESEVPKKDEGWSLAKEMKKEVKEGAQVAFNAPRIEIEQKEGTHNKITTIAEMMKTRGVLENQNSRQKEDKERDGEGENIFTVQPKKEAKIDSKKSENTKESESSPIYSEKTSNLELLYKSAAAKDTLKNFASDLKEKLESYKPPVTKLSMELNPQDLGKVDVTIITRGNNLVVQLTSNQAAINLFAQNQIEFKNNLANLGFNDVSMQFSFSGGEGGFNGGEHGGNQRNNNRLYKQEELVAKEALDSLEITIPKYI